MNKIEEYSIEWFRWHRDNHPKWLGTQAYKLLEHYEQLEAGKEDGGSKMKVDERTLKVLDNVKALITVARVAKDYRRSTTDWLMDEDDREDLVRADGNALDKALKEVEHLLD